MIDTDPLYALFTSGSTGSPKGAVVSHRNVISYISWFTQTFSIDSDTVFGSQTPLYFSMSVSDVFSTIASGAALHLLSKKMFSFPMQLIEYLNSHEVNTIYWVPSALCLLANWKIFDYCEAKNLRKILFAGEAMPTRQLNYWIAHLPNALYANLFGPTETTDICAYYILNRKLADDEPVPIGRACNNCDVFVLRENGTLAGPGEEGELYVRGSFVVPGYYGDPEKTAAAFVQNPLNPHYPEIVYRTGDLVRYDRFGDLEYICRKDFQIKHMGYRIELGEIEAAASCAEEIASCAALYDSVRDQIVFAYQAKKLTESRLMELLAKRLPSYMMPGRLIALSSMPHNANGKIDRVHLKNTYLA